MPQNDLLATFDLAPESKSVGGYVLRKAPVIFRTGNYPDKNFSMTPEELESAARKFNQSADIKTALIDLEHIPTVLDGKLGALAGAGVSPNREILFGTTAVPAWLDSILGPDERKISVTFDRATKTIKGIALVRSPRIEDAHLVAAFSAAPPEQKKSPADVITFAREVTMTESTPTPTPNPPTPNPTPPPPSPDPQPKPIPPTEFANQDAEIAQLRAKVAETEKQIATERTARFASEAVAFAETEMRTRIYPCERAALIEFYKELATTEIQLVHFGNDGQMPTLLSKFKVLVAARPAHKLEVEFLKNGDGYRTLNSDQGKRDDIEKAAERAKASAKRENERQAASKA